jgi:lipopolysaccharide transport system permease protein
MSANGQSHFTLWQQFTRREIESRHRGSMLGLVWTVLNPLLEFAIYAIVFGVIFGGRYGVAPDETAATYALGVFLSLCMFRLAAETLGASPSIIVGQANLVKKVVFPLHILPLATLGGIIFRSSISLGLFGIALLTFGPPLNANAFWFPLVLAPLLIGCLGGAWLLSALGVFLRDLTQITGPASMVMLYSSAIFYSQKKIETHSATAWQILRWNPLLHLVEDSRRVLLWGMSPSIGWLLYAWIFALGLLAVGWLAFRRLRPAFADVL